MDIRAATDADAERLGAFIAAQQADPAFHIAYLGTDAAGIVAELHGLEPLGLGGVLVAEAGGRIVGALGVDWDDDPPRVWWNGPFAEPGGDWDAIADTLRAAALPGVPVSVVEEELAPDDRNTRVAAFARRHGFTAEEASVALRRQLGEAGSEPPGRAAGNTGSAGTARVAGAHGPEGAGRGAEPSAVGSMAASGNPTVRIEPLAPENRDAVAALHDRLFPGTHRPGGRLDEGDDRIVLVARADGVVGADGVARGGSARADAVAGYVAAERQPEADGYIDFLGVDEPFRRAGVGAALVEAACRELRDRFGCGSAHLTVRESLSVARRLYERCGFVEERLLRAWRRPTGSSA